LSCYVKLYDKLFLHKSMSNCVVEISGYCIIELYFELIMVKGRYSLDGQYSSSIEVPFYSLKTKVMLIDENTHIFHNSKHYLLVQCL